MEERNSGANMETRRKRKCKGIEGGGVTFMPTLIKYDFGEEIRKKSKRGKQDPTKSGVQERDEDYRQHLCATLPG